MLGFILQPNLRKTDFQISPSPSLLKRGAILKRLLSFLPEIQTETITVINFFNLSLQRGTRLLFSDVNLQIHRQQRVGLTGANGTGKSSLFQLVLGTLHSDAGDVLIPANTTIAHVAQETPASDLSAVDYVLQGDVELCQIEAELENADDDRLATLHEQLANIDGYTARSHAARLLHGLGFQSSEITLPVKTFSGGWRMRLNLAQALMCRSDLLLLDEPTNHLDMDAVIWLEQWLKNYPGILMLVSHDREFLDAVVTHIAHIEHQSITAYTGNYSAFEKQRAEKLAQQQAAHEKQQREIKHLHKYIDRFRAQATKARQAQSRLKMLDRMDIITAAHVDSQFQFDFPVPQRCSDPLLAMDGVSVGYDATPILSKITLSIRPGNRIGLLGPNGAGKSTLIRLLAEELKPLGGDVTWGKGIVSGYFAQHQLEQLDPEASALLHLQRIDKTAQEQALRDFLGGFGFKGERADEPVAPFSGGEKSRLVLAMLVWQKPNLLLLDEPTNHLDLEMRHALTMALQGYEGALVIVSHDRHLLRTCTDELYLVHDGSCDTYNGDLDDYRKTILEKEKTESELNNLNGKPDRKQQRRNSAEQRKKLQPINNKIKKIERRIEALQKQQNELEKQLSDSEIYADSEKERLKSLLLEQAETKEKLEMQELEWLELNEELEDITASLTEA